MSSVEQLVRDLPRLAAYAETRTRDVAAPAALSFVAPYQARGAWPGDPTLTRALILLEDHELQLARSLVRWYHNLDRATQELVRAYYWRNEPIDALAERYRVPPPVLLKRLRSAVAQVERYLPAKVG